MKLQISLLFLIAFYAGNLSAQVPGKPLMFKSQSNSELTFIPIGKSGNAYGIKGNPRTQLWADPGLNAVVFTHRMPDEEGTGGVDRLGYDVSLNRGAVGSWTNNIDVYDPAPIPGSYYYVPVRYPQGAIYNPLGNTDPSKAYYVYFAPVLDGSNDVWGGYGYGVNKLTDIDPAMPTQHNEKTSGEQIWRYIPNAFTITQDGEVWMLDVNYNVMENYYTGNLIVNQGVFDSDSNDIIYTEWMLPALHGGDSIMDVKVEFSPDGQTGYICLLTSSESDPVPFTSFHPVLYTSNDGGESWSEQAIHCQLGGPEGLDEIKEFVPDSLLPGYTNNRDSLCFTLERSIDMVVDRFNTVHILGLVSLTDTNFSWEPAMYTMGTFHLSYNSGHQTWDSELLYNNCTYDHSFENTSDVIINDNHPQVSIDWEGENVFFSWLDTEGVDTLANLAPDIYSAAYDVIKDFHTEVISVTAFTQAMWQAYFACQSKYVFVENLGYETRYYLPFVYQEWNLLNPLEEVQYWYIDGFYWSKINIGVQEESINSLLVEQNIPNPFNDKTIINIRLKPNTSLKIQFYDISGRMILEKPIENGNESIELNANDFKPGCYFYSVISDEKTITKKMIVQ